MILGTIIILALTAATIAIAALVLAPRLAETRVVYAVDPDLPKAFGYRTSWIAVRTRDTGRVVETLGLEERISANWDNGLGTVYSETEGEGKVFVTPPVNGWTFVVGLGLPQPLGRTFADKTTPLLLDLGAEFIEVQYFLAYPALDCFAWARVVDGKLVRAYAINDHGLVWNKGRAGKEERSLGARLYEVRGARRRKASDAEGELILYPTEQHVLELAGKWSLDPSTLGASTAQATTLGVLGRAPARWRPERLRKTA